MSDTQTTKPRFNPRKMVAMLAALVVLVTGTVLAIARPWVPADPSVSDDKYYDDPVSPWNVNYVNGPTFNCAINAGKPRVTNGQVDKLVPCYNQSFHVIVDEKDQPRIGDFTKLSGGGMVQRLDIAAYDSYKDTKQNTWVFSVLWRADTQSFQYDFSYLNGNFGAIAQDWEIYYRYGDEPWKVAGNFNDYSAKPGARMEAILLFLDSTQPRDLVPTPFGWGDVPKGWYLSHFADNK